MKDFVSEFETIYGNPTRSRPFAADTLQALEQSLCSSHHACLKRFGEAEFHGGLMRLVNPLEFSTVADAVLAAYPMFANQIFFPVLIGAFGQVDMIDIKDGIFLRFQLFENRIMLFEDDLVAGKRDGADAVLKQNLLASDPEDFDLLNDDGESIFTQLSQKLGPLAAGEIFALTPEPSDDFADDILIGKMDFMQLLETTELHPQLVTL